MRRLLWFRKRIVRLKIRPATLSSEKVMDKLVTLTEPVLPHL